MVSSSAEAPIQALMADLVRCTSFEEAARAVLRATVGMAESTLARSRFARAGRIVRGVVHLRPDDGYRGLVVMEASAGKRPKTEVEARLTSTTAWRWVAAIPGAVSVDVHVGRIEFASGSGPATTRDPGAFTHADFRGGETHTGLIARDVTHLYVVPLRGLLGTVDGMLALEAECRPAIGAPFVWADCGAAIQLCADVAAPHIAGLPARETAAREVDSLLPVVGASMGALVELLRTFARHDEPILLTGPTGAGKSRMARWCHERSPRRDKPFEVLDLCAVPESLQMAELFGWKKGAFTGAVRDKAGYIAQAKGGTVFIDEIDNLSPQAQSGLLHVLEEKTYRVLGDERSDVFADVRFIVGTNANLQNAVRDKRFREDLYYRINVLPVRLPPLAERTDEIVPWARFMASRRHGASAAGAVSIAAGAEALLTARAWPGNLRQLDNIVRRAYAIASMGHGGRPAGSMVIEEEHVRHALTYEDWGDGKSLVDMLLAAATAFVREARRREPTGLDLDWADAFKGFVLGVATEECNGNREDAFALVGKEKLARARNHHKVLRRELDRVDELCRALGERVSLFAAIASRPESDGPPDGEGRPSKGTPDGSL